MAYTFLVFRDHAQVAEHPQGSAGRLVGEGPDQVLEVTEPSGSVVTYRAGEWHAAGVGAVCGYVDPRDDCPNCTAQPAGG